MEKLKALNEAKLAGRMLTFWENKNPKCPHCGVDYDISEHEAWQLYEEGEHEVECGACEVEFSVSTHVRYTFSTDEQDDD